MKITKEQMNQLPPDIQAQVKSGRAIAVKIFKPFMSNTMKAFVLGGAVTLILAPLFAPLSMVLYEIASVALLVWTLGFFLLDTQAAKRLSEAEVNKEVDKALMGAMAKYLSNKGVSIEEVFGTFSHNNGLNGDDSGSDTVH